MVVFSHKLSFSKFGETQMFKNCTGKFAIKNRVPRVSTTNAGKYVTSRTALTQKEVNQSIEIPNYLFFSHVKHKQWKKDQHRAMTGTRTAASFHPEETGMYHPYFLTQVMPHLKRQPNSLKPAFLMTVGRRYVDVVIGIPTVKRELENYLITTLRNLVNNMSPKEANSTLIVVFIGETDPMIFLKIAMEIENNFGAHLDSGLIDVLAPAPSYYPNFAMIIPTLTDSVPRTRWRSKQNLDVVYTMAYAHTKGRFYLMLEDDIIARPEYIKTIKTKVGELTVSHPNWIMLIFNGSTKYCGFGNLFRSAHLINLILYLQLFYTTMPIDWLITSYIQNVVCTPAMNRNDCEEHRKRAQVTVDVGIFKHFGIYSSLNGKIHKPEGSISQLKLFFPHKNPPVSRILCSIPKNVTYSIEHAYNGINFFFGERRNSKDFIIFEFASPTLVKSFKFRTGNALNRDYRVLDGVVKIKIARNSLDNRFVLITYFDEFGVAKATLPPNAGPLEAIQIRILRRNENKIIISEIEINT